MLKLRIGNPRTGRVRRAKRPKIDATVRPCLRTIGGGRQAWHALTVGGLLVPVSLAEAVALAADHAGAVLVQTHAYVEQSRDEHMTAELAEVERMLAAAIRDELAGIAADLAAVDRRLPNLLMFPVGRASPLAELDAAIEHAERVAVELCQRFERDGMPVAYGTADDDDERAHLRRTDDDYAERIMDAQMAAAERPEDAA
jgi:uncharacterized protein (DUF2236 family)